MLIAGQSLYFDISALCVFKVQAHKAYTVPISLYNAFISVYTTIAGDVRGCEIENPSMVTKSEMQVSNILYVNSHVVVYHPARIIGHSSMARITSWHHRSKFPGGSHMRLILHCTFSSA